MIGEELIGKKPIALAEVKAILAARKKEKDLNYEQDIALKYAKKFAKLTPKQLEKVREELSKIGSLPEETVVKLIDIMPAKKEILELFIPKNADISKEDLAKVLEITKKYAKE